PALLPGVGVVRDHEVAPREHGLQVDLGGRGRLARGLDGLARAQQRLRRDAGPVRALAAHELALDDGHAQAALGQRARAVLAPRAAAEHDDVVVAQVVSSSVTRPGSRVPPAEGRPSRDVPSQPSGSQGGRAPPAVTPRRPFGGPSPARPPAVPAPRPPPPPPPPAPAPP